MPSGTTLPNMRFAAAEPPSVPGCQISRIAGAVLLSRVIASGLPLKSSTAVFLFAATTASRSSYCAAPSSRSSLLLPSPLSPCGSPSVRMTASEVAASVTASFIAALSATAPISPSTPCV